MDSESQRRRRRMVQKQLRGRGIRDRRVLEAMGRVPREEFVPEEKRGRAYRDGAMSIGCGQTISQPYMVAVMTEWLHLRGPERVLEVGTGSGYQTAVLAELAAHVYTVERVEELSRRARELLCDRLGYDNLSFRVGDGTLGWPGEAPFDRILVTAAAPGRPDMLLEQLVESGEAVAPVGSRHQQQLMHYRQREGGEVREKSLLGCVFVPLKGEAGW